MSTRGYTAPKSETQIRPANFNADTSKNRYWKCFIRAKFRS